MTISSSLIVLLTVPLVLNIVAPLLILTGWLVSKPILLLGQKGEVDLDLFASEDSENHSLKERSESRYQITGLEASIADENGVYTGVVADVSREGLCLKNLPEHLSRSKNWLSVVIRRKDENFCCFIKPCWEQTDSVLGRMIGGKLTMKPPNWPALVDTC